MKLSVVFAAVAGFLAVLFCTPSLAQEGDILIQPPLTWSINSVQIVWSVSEGTTTNSKYIYSADSSVMQGTQKQKSESSSNERIGTTGIGSRVDATAGLNSNPFTLFGLMGSSVNASGFIEGKASYTATGGTRNSEEWSEAEKQTVAAAFSTAQTKETQIANRKLVFTIDFVNHTSSRMYFDPTSANTVPVYCGNVHLGDAHLVTNNMGIAATGEAIPCRFEMPLDDTGKMAILQKRPQIKIESGQLLIRTPEGAREPVENAIQESKITGNYFTIAIISEDRITEWHIRWYRKNSVTLREALEAINEEVCSQKNDEEKILFILGEKQIERVCDTPLSFSEDSDWVVQSQTYKKGEIVEIKDTSEYLDSVPGRGARFVFIIKNERAKRFITKAKQGDAKAQFYLGVCYYNGEGVEKDLTEAVKWYRKAAEQGLAEAQCNLGVCYDYGEGVEKDITEAVKWYRKAAEQGDARAQCNLGVCYAKGEGVEKDLSEAVKWYRKAAEQGYADAQFYLGLCYAKGEGVEKDLTEAVKWCRKAAEQGDAEAQALLGLCYDFGEGVEKKQTEAVKWYRKAAEQGDAKAQFYLGVCYYFGEGIEKDLTEAVKWYRKAAEQGLVEAQTLLGGCYDFGDGVEKDQTEAIKWYRKAAEQGDAEAQCNLGVCYDEGEGVEKDITEAVKWYRKAAEQGYADAQFRMGYCYYYGEGVEKDRANALQWWRKAANQGYEPAIKALKAMQE